ncbi:MAG: hypothetical protein Q7J84_08055 [Sulfuricaulis sp.]|nr:hypothetical protein [Sulfuricaulis sp.]
MPTNRIIQPLPFKGGWDTSLGPQAAEVTHLLRAENVYYELDGGVRKMPGADNLNATQLTEGGVAVTVMSLFDFWKSGTAGTPVQKHMAYAGTKILKEDLDGVFDTLTTGLEADKPSSFTSMNDIAIWSSTSNTDVPQSWDQSAGSTSTLAGSPPNFAFAVPHRNRMWAAGVASNPSRLYYSVLDSAADWTGAGSGSIDIDINDGDNITGLASHKQRLWVFKGPNTGSISYITGSAPTGTDAYARVPFNRGVPCVAHQTVVTYLNDVAFLSNRGLHSLTATEAFGDLKEGFLSFPIQSIFTDELAVANLNLSHGVNHRGRGLLMWSVRQSGQSQNNWVTAMDYRFQPGRFSLMTPYKAASLAVMLNASKPTLYSGGYDGYVLQHDQSNRNIMDVAYTAKVQLPFLHHKAPDLMKMSAWLRVGIVPQGDSDITVQWQNDENEVVSGTVSQSSGAVLGGTTGFTLDTDTLGGANYVQRYLELPGSYKTQQLTFSQAGLNEDMEIHEVAVQLEPSGMEEI